MVGERGASVAPPAPLDQVGGRPVSMAPSDRVLALMTQDMAIFGASGGEDELSPRCWALRKEVLAKQAETAASAEAA